MAMPTELERLTVARAMRDLITISPDETLEQAATTMRDQGVTALAVVDSRSQPAGIITERDVGRAMATEEDPRTRLVRDFLTANVIAATADWTLERAARTMAKGSFRHLLVFDEGRVAGILSESDVLRAWAQAGEASGGEVATGETGEIPTLGAAQRYLYSLRRTAKQHLVAAKCPCQWEWVKVLEGQLEDRPKLDEEMLRHLWERREPCPALHAEGGGAD